MDTLSKKLGMQSVINSTSNLVNKSGIKMMTKPRKLYRGDKVAIVSLSWGGLGDTDLIHKYEIAKKRLEEDFGLRVLAMPHALKGSEFVANHPELRAKDLMEAFSNPEIKAVFCAIGGDDTIRLLPYIDYQVIKDNPKVFMGYSDSTVNHFMMYQAGLVSFYGPSIMNEFGEYVGMFDYTVHAIKQLLFQDSTGYQITSSPIWSKDKVAWREENINVARKIEVETKGHEVLQGKGKVQGQLLGGCLDVFVMANGTEIWPSIEEWNNAILFIETSEEEPSPDTVTWALRNLAAQGILKVINGILVGKPHNGVFYEEYKQAILQVVAKEEGRVHLPILYNMNFGHGTPIGILPYGIVVELDCEKKLVTLLESATVL